MIYSFLPENINAELGVKADKVFPRQHDYLEFYVEGNSLRVEEWVDEYGEATQMRTERIALKPGDHLIVNSIAGLTLLQLLKMKIKVSILSRELIPLPPEQQTKDKVSQLRYFLVSSLT